MKRVVVTGLGAITPLGNNVSEFWDNLVKGTCGIKEITKFDTTNYKVKLAAEVHQFDPLQYMDKMELRHTDLYAQYAMAAACQAMEDSGIQNTIAPERIGVYMGSGIGGMSTFMSEHTALLEKGPRKVSPYFIPMWITESISLQKTSKETLQNNPRDDMLYSFCIPSIIRYWVHIYGLIIFYRNQCLFLIVPHNYVQTFAASGLIRI